MDANLLFKLLTEAGDDWAEKQAAYNILEDTKSSVLSKLALKSEANSVSGREMEARASVEYQEHVKAAQNAFKAYLKAKVKYDNMKIWIDLKRSEEATRRAEMKL